MLFLLARWLLLAVLFGAAIKLLDDHNKIRRRITVVLFVSIALSLALAELLLDRIENALRSAW